jgi:carotenoid cleavage dioxygenase
MVFHGLNAHRDGDDVVLQVHKVSSAFGPEGDLLPSHLTEWRIDTSGDRLRLSEQPLTELNMDLPTIDRRRTGRPVRHGWFATIDHDGPYGFEFAGLNHVDLRSGKDDRWEPGAMERAGEAFFVADGDRADEGEGWLLSYLYDRTTDRSSLGIFDAQAVADGPLARVHLPVRVPYGFHGLWVPDA